MWTLEFTADTTHSNMSDALDAEGKKLPLEHRIKLKYKDDVLIFEGIIATTDVEMLKEIPSSGTRFIVKIEQV